MIQVLQRHQHFSMTTSHINKENLPHSHQRPDLSEETHINPEDSKEKSELCRRFMDYGYCPYQKRCKFAHGSHELLKNKQANMKYKTKECQNFRKHNYCIYGKRCNFIHTHDFLPPKQVAHRANFELGLARKIGAGSSRLIQLLE